MDLGFDPHFGSLLVMGVCPPSNLTATPPPDLDNWPLYPLPHALPFPDPLPLPNIFGHLLAPGLSQMLFNAKGVNKPLLTLTVSGLSAILAN